MSKYINGITCKDMSLKDVLDLVSDAKKKASISNVGNTVKPEDYRTTMSMICACNAGTTCTVSSKSCTCTPDADHFCYYNKGPATVGYTETYTAKFGCYPHQLVFLLHQDGLMV